MSNYIPIDQGWSLQDSRRRNQRRTMFVRTQDISPTLHIYEVLTADNLGFTISDNMKMEVTAATKGQIIADDPDIIWVVVGDDVEKLSPAVSFMRFSSVDGQPATATISCIERW